jgi:hypothetical protein
MGEDSLKIFPPLYLVGMKIDCWRCRSRMPAVAILAPNIEDTGNEICILTDIVGLPENVLGYIQKRVPTFKLKYSKTVGSEYFANTCPGCSSLSGDFFLHSEPGAPFFPTDEQEASLLYITGIPIEAPVLVRAGFHVGTGEIILNHAKQIA